MTGSHSPYDTSPAAARAAGGGRQRQPVRERRAVDGILLLDKPPGLTSNGALQIVKRLYRAKKAGHTGSLDPLASGLLPICLGQATKLSAYLLGADKHYRVTAQLGERTDTGDADGKVVETAPTAHITAEVVRQALAGFRGAIDQVPPMYSALKHQGRPLYALARQGKEIEREPRPICIRRLELERFTDGVIVLDIECSKGTYVRSLVEEVAREAGTVAHVAALRRLGAGPYRAEESMTLESLESLAGEDETAIDAVLLPADSALQSWPAVSLGAEQARRLMQGCAVAVAVGEGRPGLVRIYAERQFVGIGELEAGGRLAPKRLLKRQQ